MTSIALFGTSADPPTAGHQTILKWLSYHFDWVMVWASDNPFKSHQTPLEYRAEMLHLLIEDIAPPRYNIQLRTELSHPRALMTVQKAQKMWGEAEFTLVIGADLIEQLPRWYRIETLLNTVKLLIVPRPGYQIQPEGLERLRQMGAEVSIADLNVPDVSSSTYREEGDPNIVIPPIEAYIHRKHLYECQDVSKESLPIH